jgi:hypothetical protein
MMVDFTGGEGMAEPEHVLAGPRSLLLFCSSLLLSCAPFHREQHRFAHGGRREEAAPPRAPTPARGLACG